MNESIYSKHYELKDRAKNILTGYWGTCCLGIFLVSLLVFSLLMVFSLPVNALQPSGSQTGIQSQVPAIVISYICNFFLQLVIWIGRYGLCYTALRIYSRRHVSASDIFYGFRKENLKPVVLLSSIRTVLGFLLLAPYDYMVGDSSVLMIALEDPGKALTCGAAFVGGYLLMIPVEIIIILSFFLLLDFPEKSAWEILSGCFRVTKGHKLRFFLLQLSFLPLTILCYLSFGIGFLWLIPFSTMTYALFYIEMMQLRNKQNN